MLPLFSKKSLVSTLSLGIFCSCNAPSAQPQPDKSSYNILFIFADDLNNRSLGYVGNAEVETPNIDALAQNGLVYTNAYYMGGRAGGVCAPSRGMLLTGRHLFAIHEHGWEIRNEYRMLPEVLKQHNYFTFLTGKWHNDPQAIVRGFQHGENIFLGGMHNHFEVPFTNFHRLFYGYPQANPAPHPADTIDAENPQKPHSADQIAQSAIDFIEQVDPSRRFFAYVPFMTPHDPRITHPAYQNLYNQSNVSLPENFALQHPFKNGDLYIRDEVLAKHPRNPMEIKQHIADYYAMVTHLDDKVGEIIEALKQKNLYDNTIIVFTSDNGLALGAHGLLGKQNLYEESTNLPLIISGPGIPKGQQRQAFVMLYDLYPTLCDLLKMPIPNSVQGQSFAHTINNNTEHRSVVFTAYKNYQRAVRDKQYKLIEYNVRGERNTQLFDLQADPLEMNNLATDTAYADKLTGMRTLLRTEQHKTQDTGFEF